MSSSLNKQSRGRSPSQRVVGGRSKKNVFRAPGPSLPAGLPPLGGVPTSYPSHSEEKEDVSMASPVDAPASGEAISMAPPPSSAVDPDFAADFMSGLQLDLPEEEEEVIVARKPLKAESSSRLDKYPAQNLLLLYAAEDNYDRLSRAFEGLTCSQVAAFATRWITYNRLLDATSVYSHHAVDFKASSVGVNELASALLKQSAVTSHFFNEDTPFVSMAGLPGSFSSDGSTYVSTVVKGKFGFKVRLDTPHGYVLSSHDGSGEHPVSLSEVVAKFATSRVGRLIPISPKDRFVVPSRQFLLLYSITEGATGLMCHAHDADKALSADYQFVGNVDFMNHPSVTSAVTLLAKYKSLPKDLFVVLYNHFREQKELPPVVKLLTAAGVAYEDKVSPSYMKLSFFALFSRQGKENDKATAKLTSSSVKDADLKKMVSEASKRSNGLIARMINPDLPIKETEIVRDLLFVKQYYDELCQIFKTLKKMPIEVVSSEVQVIQLADALGMHVNSFTPSTLSWIREEEYHPEKNPHGYHVGGGVPFYISSLPGLKYNPNPDSVQNTISRKIEAGQPAFIYLPSHTLPVDFVNSGFATGTDPFVLFFGKNQKLGASMMASPTGSGFIGFSPGFAQNDDKKATKRRRERYLRNHKFCLHHHARVGMQRVVDIMSGAASAPLQLEPKAFAKVRNMTSSRFASKKKNSVMVMTKVDEDIPGLDMSFFDTAM